MNPPAPGNAAEWRRTHPRGVLASGVIGLRSLLLPLVAVLFSARGSDWAPVIALGCLLAAALLMFGLAWLGWRVQRYRVGADDIRVEKGLVARSARSVPYERIQDVSLEEALVPRLLGLVEVRFETGAGGKDELKLAFVDRAEGEALRDTVRSHRSTSRPMTAAAEEPQSATLFAMTPRRLLIFGLFEFSLVIFAVLGGAAEQLDFLLPFDIWDPDGWAGLFSDRGRWLAGLGFMAQLIGAAFALAALALIGFATGLTRTVLRDWGFRLEDTPKGLRRRRGLLTRSDVVMPLHRVQALLVSTGILRRRFGWHGLEIVSLAQDSGSSSHVAVPFGQMEEIAPVVTVAGFALPDVETDWHRPSIPYRIDSVLTGALPIALFAAALPVIGTYLPGAPDLRLPGIGLMIAAGIMALRELFLWRHDRHAVDAERIYVTHGWLAPRLNIASRVKLHSVEIAQGPLARRRGYADLKLGLAGGSLVIRGIVTGEARGIRSAILNSIAGVDFSRLSAVPSGKEPADPPQALFPQSAARDQ